MKVIFLEINGTLLMPICESVSRLLQNPLVGFAPAVEALNHIVEKTGALLVIISNPNAANLDSLQSRLREWGVKETSFGRAPISRDKRTPSIIGYMSVEGEPDSFVIIDSQTKDEYKGMLAPYLVKTDPDAGGLTMHLAQRAVEILNES